MRGPSIFKPPAARPALRLDARQPRLTEQISLAVNDAEIKQFQEVGFRLELSDDQIEAVGIEPALEAARIERLALTRSGEESVTRSRL